MSEIASGELKSHHDRAYQLAVNIFCQSQASIPPVLKGEVSLQILMQTTEFALHARRAWDLSKIKIPSGKMDFLTQYSGGQLDGIVICNDYFQSIGILMHAENITIKYISIKNANLFSDCDNLVPAFIEAHTDKKPIQNISVIGLSYFFISRIRSELLKKYTSNA